MADAGEIAGQEGRAAVTGTTGETRPAPPHWRSDGRGRSVSRESVAGLPLYVIERVQGGVMLTSRAHGAYTRRRCGTEAEARHWAAGDYARRGL